MKRKTKRSKSGIEIENLAVKYLELCGYTMCKDASTGKWKMFKKK